VSCSTASLICTPHFFDNTNLFHEQPRAFTGKAGSGAGHGKILTWRAARDNIHGRQLGAVQLCDIPDMNHIGEAYLGNRDGKGFDLACPQGDNSVHNGGQREASDPIEEASQRQHYCISIMPGMFWLPCG
jgi:hypothetical protein